MTFSLTEIADCILEPTILGMVTLFSTSITDRNLVPLGVFRCRFAWQFPGSTQLVYNSDLVPITVSFATRAASSVTMAIWIARANVSSSLFTLNSAFRTASLLTEQIKRVRRASSRESVMDGKSHVLAS